MRATSLRITNYVLTAVVSIAYFVLVGQYDLFSVLFLFTYMLWPLVVNGIAAFLSTTRASQFTLLGATMAYAAWAFFLLVDVTYFAGADGQAGFELLLTAIAAAPVFLVVWVACLIIEIATRMKSPREGGDHPLMAASP